MYNLRTRHILITALIVLGLVAVCVLDMWLEPECIGARCVEGTKDRNTESR